NIAAEDTNKRRSLHFIRRDESAIDDGFVFDLRHVRRHAENHRGWELNAVLFQVNLTADLDANLRTGITVIPHPFIVVPVQAFVAAVSPFTILVRKEPPRPPPPHHAELSPPPAFPP